MTRMRMRSETRRSETTPWSQRRTWMTSSGWSISRKLKCSLPKQCLQQRSQLPQCQRNSIIRSAPQSAALSAGSAIQAFNTLMSLWSLSLKTMHLSSILRPKSKLLKFCCNLSRWGTPRTRSITLVGTSRRQSQEVKLPRRQTWIRQDHQVSSMWPAASSNKPLRLIKPRERARHSKLLAEQSWIALKVPDLVTKKIF